MENLDILIAQYKNIDEKLNSINDRLSVITSDTAVNKNDIMSLKQDVSSLKLRQAELGDEIDLINLEMKDIANRSSLEKSKKLDRIVSAIVKSLIPCIISLIVAGITLKLGLPNT